MDAPVTNDSREAAEGIFLESIRNKFEEKHTRLMAERTRVLQEVDAAEWNMQKIKPEVEDWCKRVDKKIKEVEKKVKDLEEKANNKCFVGLCAPIMSHYLLSRKMEQGATVFEKLITQCCQLPRPVGHWDVPEGSAQDEPPKDLEFQSRREVFNAIMEAVKDASISTIGVHGECGVGKSTLLKQVVNQVKKARLFDFVVMVAVAENPDILSTIQENIAKFLVFKFMREKNDLEARALELRKRLNHGTGKFLLILDDVREKLDLNKVGIPFGDNQKQFKILLASTSKDVLLEFDGILDQNTFSIHLLDQKEASDLFKNIVVGEGESLSPNLQTLGGEIAETCGGLPLAISTVARILRNKIKQPDQWRAALTQLKSTDPEDRSRAEVYSALRLSYNHIEDEQVKRLFLFCSLLSHDTLILNLLKYAIGLGLLPVDETVEEVRRRLLKWVTHLKASGLLRNSYNNEHFDMHDVVCDAAMSIASTANTGVLRLKQVDVKDLPDVEIMKQSRWIHLRVARDTVLPDEVKCLQPTFLRILGQESSTKMPADFFKEMKKLQVLDLTGMDLSSFPSSIGLLSSLQTLRLDKSVLGNIKVVGELKVLKFLSLENSNIKKLPGEIGKLVELRLLDLSGCTQLKIIPPGLLSRLTRLEELYMWRSFSQWEAEGDANQGSNASLNELSSLSHLTILEVHIPNANKMVHGNFSFFQNLKRYKIFIGEVRNYPGFGDHDSFDPKSNFVDVTRFQLGDYKYSRSLTLQLDEFSHAHSNSGIQMIWEKSEEVYLINLKGDRIALHHDQLKDQGSFPYLKKLHIQNGSEIQYILCDKLEELESLTLQGLPNLVSLCSENDTSSTSTSKTKTKTQRYRRLPLFGKEMKFSNLTRLIIKDCVNLKHLLSTSTATSLKNLKHFEVQGCRSLRQIIILDEKDAKGDSSKALILFSKLVSLEMRDLQCLQRFCSENQNIDFQALKLLKIERCPKFKGFTHNSAMVPFPKLKELQLNMTDVKRLWDDPCCVQNLTWLTLEGCQNLRCLISSSSMRQSFMQLQHLEIVNCVDVEEIVFLGGVANEENTPIIFPKLESLLLKDLPEMGRFCHGNHSQLCTSLKMLRIESCPSFETFISGNEESKLGISPLFNKKVALPMLNDLTIRNLINLKTIWDEEQAAESFCSLEKLVVGGCENLSSVFPFSFNMSGRLRKLRKLEIIQCHSVQDIIHSPAGREPNNVETIPEFKFPEVTNLQLYKLPKLKSFYRKVHTSKWPSLEKLWLDGSYDVKIVYHNFQTRHEQGQVDDIQPLFWTTKDTFPSLKELRLEPITEFQPKRTMVRMRLGVRLPTNSTVIPSVKIQRLWQDKLITFQNLKVLIVNGFGSLDCVFPSSVTKNLLNLESLTIVDCDYVKEIIDIEEGEIINVVFPNLKMMQLSDLPKLVRFCHGNNSIELPSLNKLVMDKCPNFTTFVPRLVVGDEADQVDPNIGKNNANVDVPCLFNEVVLPMLKDLTIEELVNVTRIWDEQQGAHSLEHLVVQGCRNLLSIFPFNFNASGSLKQLKKLEIVQCDSVEEIIEPPISRESIDETIPEFEFPEVTNLQLCKLPELKSFYSKMHTSKWPSLEKLWLDGSYNVKTLYQNFQNRHGHRQDDDIQPLFWTAKDTFPSLRELRLEPNMGLERKRIAVQRLWHGEPTFRNLKALVVKGFDFLDCVFPSSVTKNFMTLESLTIVSCKKVKEVIGVEQGEMKIIKVFPSLKMMQLSNLPNLVRFSHGYYIELPELNELTMLECPRFEKFVSNSMNQDDVLCLFNDKMAFPSLQRLDISGNSKIRKIWHQKLTPHSFCELNFLKLNRCDKLSSIFPCSMVDTFQKLENMEISSCKGLKSIIIEPSQLNSSSESSTINFVFRYVRDLKLTSLLKLESFYPTKHTTEWPALKKLQVTQCSNVKIFDVEDRFEETPAKQPLFWFRKEAFPCLEDLETDQDDAKKILELTDYQGVRFIQGQDVDFDDDSDDE